MKRLLVTLFALLAPSAAYAQAPTCGLLSTCPVASVPLSGTELLYLVQGGVSKKITVNSFLTGFITFPLSISLGGTGNTTANAALGSGGLNAFSQVAAGTSNFAIPVTARTVLVGAITGPVTYTLPPSGQYPPGFLLVVSDYLGSVSTADTVTLATQGGDTVDNGSAVTPLESAFSSAILETDGAGHWFTLGVGGGGGGGGGGIATKQCWTAPASGTCGSFTPGVTTTLTLTNPPASASALNIYFDGIWQNSNTWSLSGSTVTFDAPITASFVVEAQSGVPGSGVLSVGLALPNSVFVVTGSPVTTGGTLTGSFLNQNANTAFMGPASGSPAPPAFRQPSASDISFAQIGTGATTQTAQTKFQQMISGADYGMLCNGSNNDLPAFNNAQSEALALNATLVLPGGDCLMGSNVTLSNAERIIGQGKQLTTLAFTAASSGTAGIFLPSATLGTQLSNFNVSAPGETGIQIGDSTHTVAYAYLDQLAFGSAAINVLFENCSVCRLQNSDFNAGYTSEGVEIFAPLNPDNLDSFIGPNNLIIGSTLTGILGIVHVSGGGWHIHDNKIITNAVGMLYEESMSAGQVASAQTFTDNSVEGCGQECVGFTNQSATVGSILHVVVSGNQINAGPTAGGDGIVFNANARTWITNVVVASNEITTCTGAFGIALQSIAIFSVTGNEMNDCNSAGTTGVEIAASATTGLVTGNTTSGYTNKVVNSSASVTATANGP